MIRVWEPTPGFLEKIEAPQPPPGAVLIAVDCEHQPRVLLGLVPKRLPVHAFNMLTGETLTPAEMDALGLPTSPERSMTDMRRTAVRGWAARFVKCHCDDVFWWREGLQLGVEAPLSDLCRN